MPGQIGNPLENAHTSIPQKETERPKIKCWEDLLSEKELRKKGIEIKLEAFMEKVID